MVTSFAAVTARPWCWPPTKRWQPSFTASSGGCFRAQCRGIFVSYYDYYQPEAYVPASDTYIEKDSSINDNIDKLRHAATHALLTRRDVIIVASVSCIYGLGSPEYYAKMVIPVEVGQRFPMDKLITRLVEVHYERNDYDFHRGTFRVRGDALEIIPAYHHERALRRSFLAMISTSCARLTPSRARCWLM